MEEHDTRMTRRLAGYLAKRLPEIELTDVADPRKARGKRWQLDTLLTTMLVGLVSSCKGLAEVELLTTRFSPAIRKLLGVYRRVADTTMRNLLVKMDMEALRAALYRQIHAAWRRKALTIDGVPWGAVSMDGRSTTTTIFDDEYAQPQRPEGQLPYGLVRTVTSCLVSSVAAPCIDAHSVPPETNEMGTFAAAFLRLIEVYGKSLFRVVMYDSGADSEENAALVKQYGKDYIFVLKGEQPTLLAEARRLLGHLKTEEALAVSEDTYSGRQVTRRLWMSEEMAFFGGWNHLRTVVRVECVTVWQTEGKVTVEQHYYISSLRADEMTPQQWLLLVRRRWGVENACHNTWDRIFQEDDRPWVLKPQGMVAAMLLRRIAYNLLTLFRTVTQRDELKRRVPWKTLMGDFFIALVAATEQEIDGLRLRAEVVTTK